MYQRFLVNDVRLDNNNTSVVVVFSQDVDEDTVTAETMYVCEKNGKRILTNTIKVDRDTVKLVFDDCLPVNKVCILSVTKELLSITGDQLAAGFINEFKVDSAVDSSVKIINPSNYEDCADPLIKIELEEIPGKDRDIKNLGKPKFFNNYFLQISSDVNFFNVLLSTSINNADGVSDIKRSISISNLKYSPQYFIRARAQISDTIYGNWSDKVTFSFSGNKSQEQNPKDDTVIFEKDIEILTQPEDGVTPNSFIFEFSEDLDPNSVTQNDIIVLRKTV